MSWEYRIGSCKLCNCMLQKDDVYHLLGKTPIEGILCEECMIEIHKCERCGIAQPYCNDCV